MSVPPMAVPVDPMQMQMMKMMMDLQKNQANLQEAFLKQQQQMLQTQSSQNDTIIALIRAMSNKGCEIREPNPSDVVPPEEIPVVVEITKNKPDDDVSADETDDESSDESSDKSSDESCDESNDENENAKNEAKNDNKAEAKKVPKLVIKPSAESSDAPKSQRVTVTMVNNETFVEVTTGGCQHPNCAVKNPHFGPRGGSALRCSKHKLKTDVKM